MILKQSALLNNNDNIFREKLQEWRESKESKDSGPESQAQASKESKAGEDPSNNGKDTRNDKVLSVELKDIPRYQVQNSWV